MSFYPARPVEDADYLLSRAEAEAQLAGEARDKVAEEAHHALASLYLDRLFGSRVALSEPANDVADADAFDGDAALLLAVRHALTAQPASLQGSGMADLVLELDGV